MNTEIARYRAIWHELTNNTILSLNVSDFDRIEFDQRLKAEGLPFLTVTLPSLGKAMYAAFQSGRLAPVEGVKRVKGCPYPCLLRKAWETLFDKEGTLRWYHDNPEGIHNPVDGLYTERNDAYSNAAACIAQLTLMFYKLETAYSDQQLLGVVNSWLNNEIALQHFSLEKAEEEQPQLTPVLNMARRLVCRLLHRSDPMDIKPAHGSGASACNTNPWDRYGPPRYVSRLDAVYDYGTYFYSGANALVDNVDKLCAPGEEVELCSKMCFVPKDSRGPRAISTEPREFMFPQQGLMAKLYAEYEAYPVVKSMLSCIDQSRNRDEACLGSLDGSRATLDMKDASDCLSLQLVERLFPSNWVRCLKACRSEWTQLPTGHKVRLEKFAPMGSACCFPIEAVVFWAISLAIILQSDDDPEGYLKALFDKSNADVQGHKACVFGDDIIVPTQYAERVMWALEAVGLKVNRAKCFTRGPFRESCGGDYFLGRNIAAVKWTKVPLVRGNKDAINYAKFRTRDHMNNLIERYGNWILPDRFASLFAEWYHVIPILASSHVRDSIKAPIGLALIGLVDKYPNSTRTRRHPHHQVRQVKMQCEVAVSRKVDNSDWSHVLRSLLDKGGIEGTSVVQPARLLKYVVKWVSV